MFLLNNENIEHKQRATVQQARTGQCNCDECIRNCKFLWKAVRYSAELIRACQSGCVQKNRLPPRGTRCPQVGQHLSRPMNLPTTLRALKHTGCFFLPPQRPNLWIIFTPGKVCPTICANCVPLRPSSKHRYSMSGDTNKLYAHGLICAVRSQWWRWLM